jgi:hypothetical protein
VGADQSNVGSASVLGFFDRLARDIEFRTAEVIVDGDQAYVCPTQMVLERC